MNKHKSYSIVALCKLFGISRQSWYAHKKRKEKVILENEILLKLVLEQRKLMPRLGAKKLLFLLKEDIKNHGIKLGRDKFFTFLGANNLLIHKKRAYTKTTNSFHRFYKYPNLITDFVANGSNQLYVSDITYISLEQGFAYLSLITDAYSRKMAISYTKIYQKKAVFMPFKWHFQICLKIQKTPFIILIEVRSIAAMNMLKC
jgi:predicted DNA-binding protein YlxM (UPF0122 family)